MNAAAAIAVLLVLALAGCSIVPPESVPSYADVWRVAFALLWIATAINTLALGLAGLIGLVLWRWSRP